MATKEADQEDIDNVDFANYKGIYAEEDNDTKYTCPVTGAHFEFKDISKRLNKVLVYRKRLEDQELLKQQQKQQAQAQKQKEVFSSSTLSVSDELAVRNNFHSSNLKAAGQKGQISNAANAGGHHEGALYARQQQQLQIQSQQQQRLREQQAMLQQQKKAGSDAPTGQVQVSQSLKHQKAKSNMVQTSSNQISTVAGNSGHMIPKGSATATKSKDAMSASSKGHSGLNPQKFSLEQFVSHDSQMHYQTTKSGGGSRLQPQPDESSNQHNMDSLEPDSFVQSTAKQLNRMNNQQISHQQQHQQQLQQPVLSMNQAQAKQHKASSNNYHLQRNQTDVVAANQYQVKKNNFFTEPDEALVQQSTLLQHNQLYGLNKHGETDQQQVAAQMYHSAGGVHSMDQPGQYAPHQMLNVVVGSTGNQNTGDSSIQSHAKTQDSGLNSSGKAAGQIPHHHQRTAASHFATHDNRQPHNFQNVNQKSAGQLSTQPYMTQGVTSKTAQGKTRKSTSLKTAGATTAEQEQMWQMNAAGQMQQVPGSQAAVYQNVEQYNQLMAQLMKNQHKSSSVVGPVIANNLDKNNRTRTKSSTTATTNIVQKELKHPSKQPQLKSAGGSQFIGSNSNNQQISAKQLQSQTFHVTTDSTQYYSNGLQGPHTKTHQTAKHVTTSSRNREGSSVSIGNRKNSSSQQKATLSSYIRQSQGSKQIKSTIASRNQQGIGGHLNSQASKGVHRQVASTGPQFSTMNNFKSNQNVQKSSNLIAQHNGAHNAGNPTHKIIDEVVYRLSQQSQNQPTNNLAVQPQIQGSRNQKNLVVSHTTGGGGPMTINKSSKHKSSGYFDQQAFSDIMQKYQRSNRGGVSSGTIQPPNKYNIHSSTAAMGTKQQYASVGQTSSGVPTGMTTTQRNQLSAKKATRLSQYVHKEQKSRNANAHGIGTSKTINDTLHQQSIISQNGITHELTQKDVRSVKQTKSGISGTNQQRPLTSNYSSHSGVKATKPTPGSHNFQQAAQHQPGHMSELYHLGGQPSSQTVQGLSVTGASKQKLSGGAQKPTIAITAATKRKTASNVDQHHSGVGSKTKAQRAQNSQKVHLQQVGHPPQPAMYAQEIQNSQEQMIIDYVNRIQHQQQLQGNGAANQAMLQQMQMEMQQQQQQQQQQMHHSKSKRNTQT